MKKIAFYAPMKHPYHPTPSGDRLMGRLLLRVLSLAGFKVEIASRFRSWEGKGDADQQLAIQQRGEKIAEGLWHKWERQPYSKPDLWLTYHLYHKAPDWLGPRLSRDLGIPYVVAEASHAEKQATGPWQLGYEASLHAIQQADGILSFSQKDAQGILPLLRSAERHVMIPPFIQTDLWQKAADKRIKHRHVLNQVLGLRSDIPILLSVAMMRDGVKMRSYQILAKALEQVRDLPWFLCIIGDGIKRQEIEALFDEHLSDRVYFFGTIPHEQLPRFYAGSDLCIWPAVHEAYGMALLEAQSTGLPVLAGQFGGVGEIVKHQQTGFLVLPDSEFDNGTAFAMALRHILLNPLLLQHYRQNALHEIPMFHDIQSAVAIIQPFLEKISTAAHKTRQMALY